MRLTIEAVDPQTRTWEGPNGPIEFIRGEFTDGSWFSLGAKPENVAERIATLEALINVEGDYEVEAKDDYMGAKQWKLKSWPGKPVYGAPGGGGGHRGPSPSEQASMRASVALKAAVDYCTGVTDIPDTNYCLGIADEFFEWLTKTSGGNPSSQPDTGSGDASPLVPAPEPSAESGRPADDGGAAEAPRSSGKGPERASAPSHPTCPTCNSPDIGRKGRTWKCLSCEQEWTT